MNGRVRKKKSQEGSGIPLLQQVLLKVSLHLNTTRSFILFPHSQKKKKFQNI